MISLGEKVLMTGSCFSTEVGNRLIDDGYDILLNPFGILFNPASIASAVKRLESGERFTEKDVVRRIDDASAGKYSYVSFCHHGSFARQDPAEFLRNANCRLEETKSFFDRAQVLVLTFGTAWVFRHRATGMTVANCHKVPAREFDRFMLGTDDIVRMYAPLIGRHPGKRWIFTVSPIRHMADGAHGNQLSKATLLLAIDRIQKQFPDNTSYFPSYEIMMDELRDRSWYAADGSHPSPEAVRIIYEKFLKS